MALLYIEGKPVDNGHGDARAALALGRSLAEAFPEIMDALVALAPAALDGELIVPDRDGRSDFEALRRRSLMRRPREVSHASSRMPAVLVAFDVLEVAGEDVRLLPLVKRRARLSRLVKTGAGVQMTEHVPTHGEALFREIAGHDQEGIVAKRGDAPYLRWRQSTWLKIKNKEYSRRGAVEWHG